MAKDNQVGEASQKDSDNQPVKASHGAKYNQK
jgi:hypothetical protein